MLELTPKQIAEYFQRSYAAVDGLWFMKVEERYGFGVALDVDNEVWKVFPKIQARALKSLVKAGNGIDALFECLTAKLHIEGYKFEARKTDSKGFEITIEECPWHILMVKSRREKLSGEIGTLICNSEYSVWASEFSENIKFELKGQICAGARSCVLLFKSS